MSFSVSAVSAGCTVSYQWYGPLGLISGAIGSRYAINSVSAGNAGAYYAMASVIGSSRESLHGTLTVQGPPSITGPQPVVTNAGASVTLTVIATNIPAPSSYQWSHSGTNLPGATQSSYQISSVQPTNGGAYSAVVGNTCGSTPSLAATLSLLPYITSQPTNVVANAGASVTFSASVVGFPTPTNYQWLSNSTPLPGATNSSCTITNVQKANEGNYSVLVSNSVGSVTSTNASLQVDTNATVRLINVVASGAGSLGFRITGPVGTYVIQASTSLLTRLTNWLSVATNSIPAANNLWWDFTDTNAAAFHGRFYRAQLQ